MDWFSLMKSIMIRKEALFLKSTNVQRLPLVPRSAVIIGPPFSDLSPLLFSAKSKSQALVETQLDRFQKDFPTLIPSRKYVAFSEYPEIIISIPTCTRQFDAIAHSLFS